MLRTFLSISFAIGLAPSFLLFASAHSFSDSLSLHEKAIPCLSHCFESSEAFFAYQLIFCAGQLIEYDHLVHPAEKFGTEVFSSSPFTSPEISS